MNNDWLSDDWLNLFDDLKEEVVGELKKEFHLLMEDLGENRGIFVQYGEKLKKYADRLAIGAMSTQDFQVRVRDLERLTEMRLLQVEVEQSARAQAALNKATDLVLNKLIGAIV